MTETQKKMKSIWFFVGLILLAMGGLVFLSSLYSLIFHVRHQTALAYLYPGIWWGAIMVLAGFVFFLKNK
jgi:divalent metal cation (Fe/Co/Zn/Cd) transporter